MNGGSSANRRALQVGAFSPPEKGKTVEISAQENMLVPNKEITMLVRWIAVGWAGELEAQGPAQSLFGKVGFGAIASVKIMSALSERPSSFVYFCPIKYKVRHN